MRYSIQSSSVFRESPQLKLREDNKKITKEEKETLDKIKSFIGKDNEK